MEIDGFRERGGWGAHTAPAGLPLDVVSIPNMLPPDELPFMHIVARSDTGKGILVPVWKNNVELTVLAFVLGTGRGASRNKKAAASTRPSE